MESNNSHCKSDERYIHPETLEYYCNTNGWALHTPVRGFVIEFPGLGGGSCLGGDLTKADYTGELALALAQQGILLAYMFMGPWSWMNKGAVRITNAVVKAIKAKYALSDEVPYVVMGGSMGGLGALLYTAGAATMPTACLSVCPCVNVPDRFTAHPEFPRTFVRAVADYELSIEEGLKTISPIHRLEEMPDIPYFLINDCDDEVFPEAQLDEYVFELRKRVSSVEYEKLIGCKHGELTSSAREQIYRFLVKYAGS